MSSVITFKTKTQKRVPTFLKNRMHALHDIIAAPSPHFACPPPPKKIK